MAISVPRRVHIAPQGFECDRIVLPAIELDADIVIALSHDDKHDLGEECYHNISSQLSDEDIEVDRITCDLFDLNDTLESILGVIRDRASDDNITVNISAGSKISAIAGMLACMFTDSNPYYVVPDTYSAMTESDTDGTVSQGMESITSVPAYPVTDPDLQLIEVLSFIGKERPGQESDGVSKYQIGEFLLEEQLPAVDGSDKDPDEADDIYPIVNKEIIDPLVERDLIDVSLIGGTSQIRLTQEGNEMLSLGKSLLGNQPANITR